MACQCLRAKENAPPMTCECLSLQGDHQHLQECPVVACATACACRKFPREAEHLVDEGLGARTAHMGKRAAHGTVHIQNATPPCVVHANSLSNSPPSSLLTHGGADKHAAEDRDSVIPNRCSIFEIVAREFKTKNPSVIARWRALRDTPPWRLLCLAVLLALCCCSSACKNFLVLRLMGNELSY